MLTTRIGRTLLRAWLPVCLITVTGGYTSPVLAQTVNSLGLRWNTDYTDDRPILNPAPAPDRPPPVPWCAGIDCELPIGPRPPCADTDPEPGPPACFGLWCGVGLPPWQQPAPGGGDVGLPPTTCGGINCGVGGPPKQPGPGLGGGGKRWKPGDSLPVPGKEHPIVFQGSSSGPSAPSSTPNPVSYAYGDKAESEVDLTLPLPGRDFVLARSYTSDTAIGGAGVVGANWQLNVGYFLQRITDSPEPTLTLTAVGAGRTAFSYNSGASTWYAAGPTRQSIVKATLTIDIGEGSKTYPVYKLTEPGNWICYFGRKMDSGEGIENINPDVYGGDWRFGTLFRMEDVYGNQRNFTYATSGSDWRLSLITMVGADSSSDAKVVFSWYSPTHDPAEIGNRLMSAVAQRYDGSSWVDVQKAEYTYKLDDSDATSHDTVGEPGDLIQVVKSTRIDLIADDNWHTTIIQYRYHEDDIAETSTDTDSDGFIEAGSKHQLKAVLSPQQIEYAAERYNADTGLSNVTLTAYGDYLLTLADGGTAYTDGSAVKVMALASKVIPQYETSGEKRVLSQYIQSACGCGGGASQGTKLAYTYFEDTTPSDGTYARTLKVEESYLNGGSYSLRRTHYYDLNYESVTIGSTSQNVFLLANDVVTDGTKYWVTQYLYDGDLMVEKVNTPSSVSSYTPASASGGWTAPTVSLSSGSGLIYEYDYNADHRMTEMAVRNGTSGTRYVTSAMTWGSGSGDTRKHLLDSIEYHRVEGASSADDKQKTEFIYKFHSGDKLMWVQMVYEAELTAENGPNSSGNKYYAHEYFDSYGQNTWSRHEDDSLVKRTFDADTGAVATVVENASTSGLPSTTGLTGSFSGRNSDGGSLTSTYDYDLVGRVLSIATPTGNTTRYVYELRQPTERTGFTSGDTPYLSIVALPHTLSSTEFDGPAVCTWLDAGGRTIQTSTYSLTANASSHYGDIFGSGYDFDLNAELSRSTIQQTYSGLMTSSKVYHSLAGNGENSGLYTTTYTYDTLGHLDEEYAPNGTMTKYTYDVLDRVIAVSVGTSTANDETIVEYFYDHTLSGSDPVQGMGNGNLTWVRAYTGESSPTQRDTKYTYDYRDRLIKVENPAAPHAMVVYDNLNRPTKAALFSTLPTDSNIDNSSYLSGRGAYIEFKYSQRGFNYETKLKVDPTTTSGDYLSKFSWFDASGRPIALWNPNSPAVKTVYDGLGRLKTAFITDRHDDAAPGATDNRDDAASVSDDVVFEQTEYRYIASVGLNDLVTHRLRTHDADDSKVGDLTGLTGGDADLVITTYSAMYYDDADRVIRTVEYGTNQSNFQYGGSAPTVTQGSPLNWNSGGDQIVSEVSYDNRGRADLMTDPLGHQTKLIFDDLDRVIATIENYKNAALDGTPWDNTNKLWVFTGISSGDQEEDRVTSTVHLLTASPPKVKQIAHAFDSGGSADNQVTEYRYGVSTGAGTEDSRITSNDLLSQIVYPDIEGGESEADHSVYFAYNRLGEQRFTKDQAGTKHLYTADSLGRVTLDKVTAFGSGIDMAINAITYAFDSFGRTDIVKSYYDYGGGSQAVKNAVKFEYTSLWQVEKVWQQHDGDVATGGGSPSPKVTYAYATSNNANKNYSRVSSMTYPHGTGGGYNLPYSYGSSGTSNDLASRIMNLDIHGSGYGVDYSYIGAGLVALVDMAGPSGSLDVMLTRFHAHDGSTTQGLYPGFDRFGRVKRHIWADGGFAGVTNTPRIVDLSYSYDKGSNLLAADNTNDILGAWFARDSKFTHDELDRLIKVDRGLNTGGGGFSHATYLSGTTPGQAWTLDFLGNWKDLISDKDADGPDGNGSDNTETRTHNDGNELTALDPDGGGGGAAFALTHDKAGNITSRHQSYTDSNNWTMYEYVHDAWNRLVKVTYKERISGSTGSPITVGEYGYNGLTWRIWKRADTSLPTIDGLDEMRVMIYSAGWQMLEDYVDTGWSSGFTADKAYQIIYGIRYIDDVVCRRLDANVDGDFADGSDRTYYHLTDNQFSTVAIVDQNAGLLERVSYDAYGRARHHRASDLNGDGATGTDDLLVVVGNWGNGGAGDLTRNGTVNTDDHTLVIGGWGAAETSGVLSTTGNVFGFSGYVWNAEVAGSGGLGADRGGIYTVRFRHYDVGLGRWLERDPLEYVDGMSMYGYVRGGPLGALDPSGLEDGLGAAAGEVGGMLTDWFWGGESGEGLSRLRQIESAGALNPLAADDPLSQMYSDQAEAEAYIAQAIRDMGEMYAEIILNTGEFVIYWYAGGYVIKIGGKVIGYATSTTGRIIVIGRRQKAVDYAIEVLVNAGYRITPFTGTRSQRLGAIAISILGSAGKPISGLLNLIWALIERIRGSVFIDIGRGQRIRWWGWNYGAERAATAGSSNRIRGDLLRPLTEMSESCH